MIYLNPEILNAVAAIIVGVAALVWAIRRSP